MSVYRPGDQVPYSSRPENQPMKITRKSWHDLLKRVEALENAARRPLPQRLKDGADAITELNSMSGYDADAAQRAAVSPLYLRHEADEMEADA